MSDRRVSLFHQKDHTRIDIFRLTDERRCSVRGIADREVRYELGRSTGEKEPSRLCIDNIRHIYPD
jgi:hypothetical protein